MTMLRNLAALAVLLAAPLASAAEPPALDLTQRKIEVSGTLDVSAASKLAEKLLTFEAQATAPIYLLVSATKGTAQAVMMVADTIRSLESPVVGVVVTQVHGAGAALAPFTDQVQVYPSAGFVFTEVEYEGVKKPKPKKKDEKGAAGKAPDKAADKAGDKPADKPAEAAEGETPAGDEEPAEGEKKEDEEEDKEQLLLEKAREVYLQRFYARLAERMHMKPAALEAKLKEGGFLLTPKEAVAQKIAAGEVQRITLTTLPETKKEVKVITTEKSARSVLPLGLDAKGAGEDGGGD